MASDLRNSRCGPRSGRVMRVVSMAAAAVIMLAAMFMGAAEQARAQSQQKVTLRIRPPIGDTLRMQMEQKFEMAMEDPAGTLLREMNGSMRVWTRAVVLRRVGTSTELLSVTDSVRVMPPEAAALPPLRDAKRALEGRTVRLRIGQDGEIIVASGAGSSGNAAAPGVAADMPSVLPREPVAVGEAWTRDIRVPLSATERETALVRTTLRLDSLSRDGAVAYLSLRGVVSHDHSQHSTVMRGNVTGTFAGTIQIDRRLGWITGSRTTLALMSVVESTGVAPMRLRVRVTQSLRALVED